MKATHIKWEIDDESSKEYLPNEIEIPDEIVDDDEAISDYISDQTGYLHNGFIIE